VSENGAGPTLQRPTLANGLSLHERLQLFEDAYGKVYRTMKSDVGDDWLSEDEVELREAAANVTLVLIYGTE
jgi:hypothetical protein